MASSTATKFICLLIIMGLALPSPTLASVYDVGSPIGWCTAAVTTIVGWVTGGVVLRVGDVLRFVSPLLPVPVYLVSADAFAACDVSAPLFTGLPVGNALYTFNNPGDYHFIADRISCIAGLKLKVTVIA